MLSYNGGGLDCAVFAYKVAELELEDTNHHTEIFSRVSPTLLPTGRG